MLPTYKTDSKILTTTRSKLSNLNSRKEHITTWAADEEDVEWSIYRVSDTGELTFKLKVGMCVIELGQTQMLAAGELLVEAMKDVPEEW